MAPPVDWAAILAIKEDDVTDDSLEQHFDLISEIELKAEDSGATKENLLHLFSITRAVLNITHETAETYLEELTNKAAIEGQLSAKEEQKLQEENESLKHELDRLKSFGSSDVSKDARKLRERLLDMEEKLRRLEEEMQDEVTQHEATKRKLERAEKDGVEAEKSSKELKKENDRMREDMREFQRQLEEQKDKMLDKSGQELDRRDQLRQKNQEMLEQLDEIKNLSLANKKLQDEVEELSRGLEVSIAEMEQMTAAHNKIKAILAASDVTVDQLTSMNQVLQERVEELEAELGGRREGDEEIMAAVSNKVQQWKDIVAAKDEQLQERDREIAEMRNQLGLSGVDVDRNSQASLQMALKAKDADLQKMLEQINEATVELEEYRQLFEDMKQDAGPNAKYLERINELKGKLQAVEQDAREAGEKQRAAERDSAHKDQDLTEAEQKLAQYEAGEYGLAEAVVEIKQLKQQVRIRDSNVEQLIGQINGLELKLNSVWDENEALRVKCGNEPGEPLDLDLYRGQLEKRKQQDRAMNIILLNEVEKLENERMALKKQIRSLAMDKGQRAAALGLTADDIIKIDEFTETLRGANGGNTARSHSFFHIPSSSPTRRGTDHFYSSPRKDEPDFPSSRGVDMAAAADYERRVDGLEVDRNNLQTRCEHLQQDNQHLCDVIRELKNIKLGESVERIESVDKLLEVLEARHADGAYDANLLSKAKLDQLTGRNEELRAQLREVRLTNNTLSATNDKYKAKLSRLEEEVKELREDAGGGGAVVHLTQMQLPQGVSPSSSDVINSLNEHLIVSLKELSAKELKLGVLEQQLQKYKSHFSMSKHQIGVLYKEYRQKREEWAAEKQQLQEQKESLESLRESDRIRIEEFKRLQDSLCGSDDELRQQLGEVNRRITVLRVNERGLVRRYTLQRDRETELQADLRRLHTEMANMHACVIKRIGYLERFKTMSVYRIEAVQKALGETVAQSDFDSVQAELNKVTLKYRDLLEKENHLVAKSAAIELLEVEKQRLAETLARTKQEWAADKEKLNNVEQLLAKTNVSSSSATDQHNLLDTSEVSASKKIAMLEMKSINETQRAEHASRMYEYQKKALADLEARNSQLEDKFAQLTKLSLEAQTVEAELRDELTRSVSKESHDVTQQRVSELEGVEAKLTVQISKLREMVEIANLQVRSTQLQREASERELDDMRELVLDLQKDSEHNKTLGKLHHDKVNLQNKEGMLLMELQQGRERLAKLEAQALRWEQKLDEKDNLLFHVKLEARSRSMHLKKTIQLLRTKYAGCLPLEKQEKFSDALYGLHEERGRLQKEVHEAEKKRICAEDELLKLDEQHRGLQELISTLKDNKGAAKVAEWHAKITDVRLQQLKGKREMERLREKVRYLERLLAQQEQTVATLEEQQVLAARDQEQQHIHWEQRELELERMLEMHEKRTIEMTKWSEEQVDMAPDPNLPVAEQLEFSVRQIKQLVTSLGQMKREVELANKQTLTHEAKIQEKEAAIMSRDKIINELRLRMPASSNRDDILRDVLKSDPHLQHSTKVAQQLNDNLKSQLQQKSVEVEEYKELLLGARRDLAEATAQHNAELSQLQARLKAKTEESFLKFKQYAAQSGGEGGGRLSMSEREVRRLAELEDVVAEQTNIMASLNHTIHTHKRETEDRERQHKEQLERLERERQVLVTEHEKHSQHLMKNVDEQSQEISALRKEVDSLKIEFELAKGEAAKGPSAAMRAMVERLKKQLEEKEAKMRALGKALTDLRADMVSSAAESVKHRARSAEDSLNVQQIVEKQTKDLQEQLLESKGKVEKLKAVVKKCKEEEVHSHTQLAFLQDQLTKKDFELNRERPERDHSTAASSSNLFHASKEPGVKTARAVSEEAKKWQLKVDAVKDKLRAKTQDCERLERSNTLLKENLARADKERVSRVLWKESTSGVSSATQKELLDSVEATRKHNLELLDEVALLKRQALVGRDGAFEELHLRNRLLQQKVDELQEELSLRTPRKEGNAGLQDAYARLIGREESLQQTNLQLAQENIELKFQAEHAKLEMPKLVSKIEELQRQVEVLNSELYDKPVRERKLVGSSGKTVGELERTVGLMKKCMEKVQAENEALKQLPSVVDTHKMQQLTRDNAALKEELSKCRQAVEAELAGRYDSLQLGTARVAAENERLLLEIHREREASVDRDARLQLLKQDNEQLQQVIQKLRKREALDSSLQTTTSSRK